MTKKKISNITFVKNKIDYNVSRERGKGGRRLYRFRFRYRSRRDGMEEGGTGWPGAWQGYIPVQSHSIGGKVSCSKSAFNALAVFVGFEGWGAT